MVFTAHAQVYPLNNDVLHVTSFTRLPLFSRAMLKRLGEPGDEARVYLHVASSEPYGGKFSQVQTFMALFVPFKLSRHRSRSPHRTGTPCSCTYDVYAMTSLFCRPFKFLRFLYSWRLIYVSTTTQKFAPCENFLLYGIWGIERGHIFYCIIPVQKYQCIYAYNCA